MDFRKLLEKQDEEFIQNMRVALKKMQRVFIENGYANTAHDIKRLSRFEIQGVAQNGLERLVYYDLLETVGPDEIEDSDGANTFYPVVKSGVIKYRHSNGEVFYLQFQTENDEGNDFFDLYLDDYVLKEGIFYLAHKVQILSLPKKGPLNNHDYACISINELFFLNEDLDLIRARDFSEEDLNCIRIAASDSSIDGSSIGNALTTFVLSTFRVINYIREQSIRTNQPDLFISNEYFVTEHFIEANTTDDPNALQESLSLSKILNGTNGIQILSGNMTENILHSLCNRFHINEFYSATGFVYRSGLFILEDCIQKISENNGSFEMIIGALQNNGQNVSINKINKSTVKALNELVTKADITLFTYKPAFYHGKFYYLSDGKKCFCIIGSTNISRTAFRSNYELDTICVCDKGSNEDLMYLQWYQNFKQHCDKIETLDESQFSDFDWTSELDAFNSLQRQRLSSEELQQRLKELDDEEITFRLNLWDNHPNIKYQNLEIDVLEGYILFAFEEYKLAVFESFTPGNAYYIFRYDDIQKLLLRLEGLSSKKEMQMNEHYVNRGNHVQNKERLRARINKYFL